jgi:hypothetical protein
MRNRCVAGDEIRGELDDHSHTPLPPPLNEGGGCLQRGFGFEFGHRRFTRVKPPFDTRHSDSLQQIAGRQFRTIRI